MLMDIHQRGNLRFPQSLPEFQRLFPTTRPAPPTWRRSRWSDDTIRSWYRLYEEDGIEGLTNFSYVGSACQLSGEQQEKLKAWVGTVITRAQRAKSAPGSRMNSASVVRRPVRTDRVVASAWGSNIDKPNVIPRKLDEEKQKAFMEGYEKLLNSLGDDEAVLFADAVHPTHEARPVGCWAPSQEKLAIEQTSGRQRINIQGAIDLETGRIRMIEALTIDAACGFVECAVVPGTSLVTDDWSGYASLAKRGYKHLAIAERGDPQVAEEYLPIIHLVFANLKTWLNGIHHGVSHQHLQAYLNEFTFRFNRRFYPFNAFRSLLGIAGDVTAPTYAELYSGAWQHPTCRGCG